MRRSLFLLLVLIALAGLCVTASAATGITSMNTQVTVSPDSTCQLTTQLQVHLDQPVDKLVFPVPENASAISVNGSRVLTQKQGGVRNVDLTRVLSGLAGDVSVTVSYRLSELVQTNDADILQLTLPLLSGFRYPVQGVQLTVLMPGPVEVRPSFVSGYHQANIEKDLVFSVEGATISCRSQGVMKDHETLQMVLTVSEEMFPQSTIYAPDLEFSNIAAIVCACLAFLYWLFFLRFWIPIYFTRTNIPDGYTAGEYPAILHLQGADLSLMALTWAQQGYITIVQDKFGSVRLHKQMDMGNECSLFQQRCFRALFAKRSVVDTGSAFYVQQYKKVSAMTPNLQGLVKKGSGNRKIFRILTALCGMFVGVSLGVALSAEAAAPWLWAIVMGAFGLFSTYWGIDWGFGLILPNPTGLWISGGIALVWLLLGVPFGQYRLALWAVALLTGYGLLNAFSGRRTPEGRQLFSLVLGLRRYLRRAKKQDIQRISQNNPEYFHQMVPYALALGVDRPFAKAFGSQHTLCPYVADPRQPNLTAIQWSEYLRRLVKDMNKRVRRQGLDRILKFIKNFVP